MSFNAQHITPDNYNEAFLLYVDGELTPQQMDAVDAFVAAQPQYAEELELLMAARLGDDFEASLSEEEKEQLLAPQMKAALAQEDLLLYLDGELDPAAAAQVQKNIDADGALQQSWQQFKATKLVADEAIVFPNKQLLLRKEEQPVRRIGFYLRAAVIAGIVVTAGLLLTKQQDADVNAVANTQRSVKPSVNNTQAAAPQKNSVVNKEASEQNNSEAVNSLESKSAKGLKEQQLVTTPKLLLKQKELRKKTASPVVEVQQEQIIAHQPAPRTNNLPAPEKTTEPVVVEKIETVVTNNPTQPYIQTETAQPSNTAATFAAVQERDKRGSVRGLLRKATRFIERRTGAELTDEEDRLLIGALAVKLK